MGYLRVSDNTFTLTPNVLSLGMVFISSLGLWDIALSPCRVDPDCRRPWLTRCSPRAPARVAAPVRDGTGAVRAAMDVTVHAAETSTEHLVNAYLPLLLLAAARVSGDWALWKSARTSSRPDGRTTSMAGCAGVGRPNGSHTGAGHGAVAGLAPARGTAADHC